MQRNILEYLEHTVCRVPDRILRCMNIASCEQGFIFGFQLFAAKNLHTITGVFRPVLSMANFAGKVLGDGGVNAIGGALNKVGVPLWTPSLPGAFYSPKAEVKAADRKVVYFPSCINQTMGQSREKGKKVEIIMLNLLGGFEIKYNQTPGIQYMYSGR